MHVIGTFAGRHRTELIVRDQHHNEVRLVTYDRSRAYKSLYVHGKFGTVQQNVGFAMNNKMYAGMN